MTQPLATSVVAPSTLDYYLLGPAAPVGLLVEEFELADDLSATRLRTAGWTPADGGWWSAAAFTRAVRANPDVRARVRAVTRADAEETYRRLGGGVLPDDDALRDRFRDDVPLAATAPLRLGFGPAVHRVLFAGDLDAERLTGLRVALRLDGGTDPGVVGTGRLHLDGTALRWDLRRVGGGVAWCLDVTAEPLDREALRPLLHRLTDVVRRHGLIPATIECFT
ncbi:hypothetical protein O7602_15740 [Micromonospora sp. WMMD1128]|uniref:hypothetical protein n=1 Tax=unclassified Micromonospora TaxID=2617518 RepID=UPI00248D10E0|nr:MULTISPECIES: hypothetical protein [unclassified Micromonospora]WBB71214.1 hypothetical protein O7602_15740 [Micromonospora sp. WMMD1128]WFE35316.1 hypothetical protein O7613_08035 [Micromonospora sp. WMMD975]